MQQKKQTIDQLLKATWQGVAKMYNEHAAKYDTTMATAFTLLSIDKKEGTPSTALGPKMGMEPTSLSRILKTMEEKGVIYREPNPNDGRGVLIKLTDTGKVRRELSKKYVLRFDEAIRNATSKEKINHFLEVIEIIKELSTSNEIFTESFEKEINLIL